jgi:4-oxalocrotonate tautomerase
MRTLNYGEESVSVAFEEVEPKDWASKVYHSDVVGNESNLYKKPGYRMCAVADSIEEPTLLINTEE